MNLTGKMLGKEVGHVSLPWYVYSRAEWPGGVPAPRFLPNAIALLARLPAQRFARSLYLMSILVNKETRVITQGITGTAGAFHTKGCLDYGTKMVGVTPGKGGQQDPNGLPIFDTVRQAVESTQAEASMIFVPPPFAADAIMEAAAAGIKVIVAITEGVPVLDMVKVKVVLVKITRMLFSSARIVPA